MCGFVGYIAFHQTSSKKELVKQMAQDLVHRGPDDFDQKTIDFYKELLDELEKSKIEPFATLIYLIAQSA